MNTQQASVVGYRMTGEINFSIVSFEGPVLSLEELKLAIINQRDMMNEKTKMAFDLRVIDEETGREYTHGKEFVPKNTQVMVKRIAVRGKAGRLKNNTFLKGKGNDGSSLANPLPSCVQTQEYVCRKCGEQGHNIKQCPNQGIELPTKSYAFNQREKTAFINPNRVLFDIKDPRNNTNNNADQSDNQQQPENPTAAHEQNIPENCSCSICHSWLTQTTSLSCCKANVCQACFDQHLSQSSNGSFSCPSCNTSVNSSIPNPRHDKLVSEIRIEHAKQAAQQQAMAMPPPPRTDQNTNTQNKQYNRPQQQQQQQQGQQQQQQQGQQQQSQQFSNHFADVTCRNCQLSGHYPSHCPQPLREGVWLNPQHAERRKKWLQDQGLPNLDNASNKPPNQNNANNMNFGPGGGPPLPFIVNQERERDRNYQHR
jgi:hypothetical protein